MHLRNDNLSWWHIGQKHASVSCVGNSTCCLLPETMTHLAGKWYRQKKKQRWILILQKLIFFILFYELKNIFVTALYLFFLFTNRRAVLSLTGTRNRRLKLASVSSLLLSLWLKLFLSSLIFCTYMVLQICNFVASLTHRSARPVYTSVV